MNTSDLLNENTYTDKLPTYLRSYDMFFKFIKMLTNYVSKSIDVISYINSVLQVQGKLGENNYSKAIMKIICENYDIPFMDEVDDDISYNNLIFAAIQCIGLKRDSFSTLEDLKKGFLNNAKIIDSYVITDSSVLSENPSVMNCSLSFTSGFSLPDDFIMSVLTPEVTGVHFTSTLLNTSSSIFAYDRDNDTIENVTYDGWDKGNWAQEIIIQ